MKYQSGGAFRRALEDRLRTQSLKSGVALVRLRKMVAEVNLGCYTLAEASQSARRFLDPVLQGAKVGVWNPATCSWQP